MVRGTFLIKNMPDASRVGKWKDFQRILREENVGEFLGWERLESQILFGAIGASLNAQRLHINV